MAEPLLVEHFKVRDSAGSVIGVAARHWNGGGAQPTTTWSVLIPSRGALVLSAPGEARGALDDGAALERLQRRQSVGRPVAVPMTPGTAKASSSPARGEFEGLTGSYTESWTVAAVDEDGRVERHDRARHRHEPAAMMKYLFVAIVGFVARRSRRGRRRFTTTR